MFVIVEPSATLLAAANVESFAAAIPNWAVRP
jgi:hypothetical protein